ncbi:ACP S-malonyltransferase [Paraburkholderia dilworthii]|uniref:ACP S-malonyltransferase n=1 Tax=Paraburkholderia dilworthii TaxID=948106 RepID=UPI00040A3494|nr:ACP S-malonyltransferase [Paraburkholderia dilworthii]
MQKKIAYVFPGQGSQAIGMLDSWSDDEAVRSTIDEASRVLGLDLWSLIRNGPGAELNRTDNTQPALVAVSVALLNAWRARGGVSGAMAAGHSVGEYAALVASGALTIADAIRVVRARGEAMYTAVPPGTGGMAAVIGLDDETVRQLCASCAHHDVLAPANYNAPGQVVVAGHVAAIERLGRHAREAGAKIVLTLPVSGPFHSPLMRPAADALHAVLGTVQIGEPAFAVWQNSDLRRATRAGIRDALVAQLVHPVRWTETIRRFEEAGVTHIVEIGPGEVLTHISARIAPGLCCLATSTPALMDTAIQAVAS